MQLGVFRPFRQVCKAAAAAAEEVAVMADYTQLPPRTSAGKRSACDRCRTQKLGCMRVPGHPGDACLRCVRSQAECVTSSSRRPGRPVRAAAASSPAALPSPDVEADVDVDVDNFPIAALDIPYNIPYDLPYDSSLVFLPDYLPDGLAYSGDRSPTPILDHHSPLLDHRSTPSTPSPPHKHHQRFLRLHQTLSHELALVQSTQCDLAEVFRVTCVHPDIPPRSGLKTAPEPHTDTTHRASTSTSASLSSPKSNPLATVTTHAAEFLSLLHTLHPLDTTAATTTTTPTTPDLLTALSCYILLVSIYDALLAQFLAAAATHAAAPDTAAPVLALGGLPVPLAPTLPANLLISLLNSQLQPIETCLGLPEVLRVCEGGRSPPGVGPGHNAGLFGRPGGQALCMALVQVEGERAGGHIGVGSGVMGVVAALREKRRRALGL
ncbi:Zn(II)2Cys6 transcription factor domain-containing protein [Aspergillus mulundensis]|uniref:Zn(2)-C6 fungal-type domain-containing protein n=1 Tax=Aspergillus mulundensis TaxID=1810919 RepID=A0A3D8R4D7_9EURO|nr:hypothetical protein DSM5745_08683 [Aspergillus mulundensis]RDW68923.1 hypothetical protein DSM5745_08683 [Aspergillus mulundensis]